MKVSFTPKQRQPPDVTQGIKVAYAPGRRSVSQWRWYLIVTLVSSPFFYLLFKLFWPYVVLTAPGFISLHKTTLTAPADGLIQQIHVQVGQAVANDQLLLELAAPKLTQRIRALRKELGQLTPPKPRPQVKPARQNVDAEALVLHRQIVDQAAQTVTFQQQRYAAINQLFRQRAATAAEVNAVRAQLDAAQHTLTQARLDLVAMSSKRLPEQQEEQEPEQASTDNRLQLEEHLQELEAEHRRLTLRAPLAGTVLDIPARQGAVQSAGESLIVLGTQEKPQVIAYLRPEASGSITAGRTATVTLPGGPALLAQVHEAPTQARRLPADLSSVIGTRDVMVIVTLDITDPFPAERAIENLPVDVRFHRFW